MPGRRWYLPTDGTRSNKATITTLTTQRPKARINHCEIDTNEEVQDRCSGRLPKCGA